MNISDEINHLLDEDPLGQEPVPSFALKAGEPIATARIASNLRPRTLPHIRHGSRAFIVGYDGPNITKEGYPWKDLLLEWIEKGCDIYYLLVKEPSTKTLEILRSLPQKKVSGKGSLTLFTVKNPPELGEVAADYLEQWKTFHFAIFENPKQLWIESHHEPGETTAQDCYYFEPAAAENSPLLDVYKSRFEYVVKHCGEPVSLS